MAGAPTPPPPGLPLTGAAPLPFLTPVVAAGMVGHPQPPAHPTPPTPAAEDDDGDDGGEDTAAAGAVGTDVKELADVTRVSGVDLKGEQALLLAGADASGRPADSAKSSAAAHAVRIEEGFLFPDPSRSSTADTLQNRIAAIARRYGVKRTTADAAKVLSLAVEERLRTLLNRLVVLSKQRADEKRTKGKVKLGLDMRKRLRAIEKRERDAQEKREAREREALLRAAESKDKGTGDSAKDEKLKAKAKQARPTFKLEEEDRIRASAANLAAMAAIGDVKSAESRWAAMAANANRKPLDTTATTLPPSPSPTTPGGEMDSSTSPTAGTISAPGMQQQATPLQQRVAPGGTGFGQAQRPQGVGVGGTVGTKRPLGGAERSISMRDLLLLLEQEPQSRRSELLYKLYMRVKGAS
eukprot:jgi/Chlat1/8912/Chrsp92S00689